MYSVTRFLITKGKRQELSATRRAAWLSKINRKDWTPGPGARVCSAHFLSGNPSTLYDVDSPDWVPSVSMGYGTGNGSNVSSRYNRLRQRKEAAAAAAALLALNCDGGDERSEVPGITCQTDKTGAAIDTLENLLKSLQEDIVSLRSEHISLKKPTNATSISPEVFQNSKDIIKFYTGLPNWSVFNALMTLISPALPPMPNSKLSRFTSVVMFLMKLRLNLYDEDLAFRFGVLCHEIFIKFWT